jgi:hypothetical protein
MRRPCASVSTRRIKIALLNFDLESHSQSRRESHSEQAVRDVRDLSKPIQQELEKFFIATDVLEDKKLEIIGWKGPKTAMKAIKYSAKAFAKDGE